ncbi:hypothetical protein Q0Q01_29005, partial [Escherichia coli O8:H10]
MITLSNLIQSEIADFFAGFGGPGEPDIQSGEAQHQLTDRVLDLLRKEREAAVPDLYCMSADDRLDPEAASTSRAVVDRWVDEWNDGEDYEGKALYKTVALYAAPPAQPVAVPVRYMNRYTGVCYTLEQQPDAATDTMVYVPLYDVAQPVAVPDERAAFNAWNNDIDCPLAGRDAKTAAWLGWSRRSAMLNQAPVKQPASNSPVIPDGWISEAESLAELHGLSFVIFRPGEQPRCSDPTKVVISFTDKGLGHQPAEPKQEP